MHTKRILNLIIILSLLWICTADPAIAEPRAITYLVNSNEDTGDADIGNGICATSGGNCTLRAAIEEANHDGTATTIHFASSFTGTNDISPNPELPALTENNTTIDASSQFNYAQNQPGVEISSSLVDQVLNITSEGNTIRGIFFGGAPVGIKVAGNNNIIGGSGDGQRNVFLNPEYGVHLCSGSYHSVISNFFGTIDGETITPAGSGDIGVWVDYSHHNVISDNLIVGYRGIDTTIFPPSGIVVYYGNHNQISNNIIGMDRFKCSVLSNQVGIYLNHADNTDIGSANLIAGNTSHGVHALSTEDLSIFDNDIGYWCNVNIGNGGNGISLETMLTGTSIYNNTIRYNAGSGILSSSVNTTIQANSIYTNAGHGIYLSGDNNLIGGTDEWEMNRIYDNDGNGIYLDGACSNTISNNYVTFNDFGILIENGASDNTIGGNTAGESNWIGENTLDGIRLQGSFTHNNLVIGNKIGIDDTLSYQVGNGHHGIGIYDGAHNNQIGTTNVGEGNTVVDSGWSGIVIVNSSENSVEGNLIGTDWTDNNWGNAYFGVNVVGSGNNNFINFNEIAYNGTYQGLNQGQAGIKIDGSSGNMISRNSIHDNDGPGISLVNNSNNNMPEPIIDAASCKGPIEGTANPFSWVQIFSDHDDEGRLWEGTAQAGATGNWSWSGTVNGPNITATSRDNTTNDTSAFSAPFPVGTCNTPPSAAFTVEPTSGTTSTNFAFDASGSSDLEDPTSALMVRWDWENDGIFDTTWSTSKFATHQFGTIGLHTVRLIVRDTGGLIGQATRQISVGGQPIQNLIFLPLMLR